MPPIVEEPKPVMIKPAKHPEPAKMSPGVKQPNKGELP